MEEISALLVEVLIMYKEGTQEIILFVVLSLMTLVIENCIKNHKGNFLQ